MTAFRKTTLALTLAFFLALVALALMTTSPAANSLAGSSGTVVPDVGSILDLDRFEAGSSGTVVPDVGAAPARGPALAGSSGTVVPDVG